MTINPEAHIPSKQPMYRRSFNVLDQFGRKWLISVETVSGGMASNPIPAGWSDPIKTPSQYCVYRPDKPTELFINHEAWARHLEEKMDDWTRRYEDEGYDRFGEKFDPTEPPSPTMMRLVGPKPMDPAIPRAAANGDEKYLGMKPVVREDIDALKRQIAALEAKNMALMNEGEGPDTEE